APRGTLLLDPPVRTVNAGSTVGVLVKIDLQPGVLARAVEFGLSYDPAVIRVNSITPSTFFSDWATATAAQTANVPHCVPATPAGPGAHGAITPPAVPQVTPTPGGAVPPTSTLGPRETPAATWTPGPSPTPAPSTYGGPEGTGTVALISLTALETAAGRETD